MKLLCVIGYQRHYRETSATRSAMTARMYIHLSAAPVHTSSGLRWTSMGVGMGTGFLKLIFASVEQMRPSLHEDEYLGWTKKLLSLMTPVGSVHLSVLCSPFDEQLSMLYNRFSLLMLAICILPSTENVLYHVSLARRYVNFGRSTMVTCSVCICAANYLALQALDMVLPVGPALDWTSEIMQVLISEFRAAVAVAGGIGAPPANDDAHRHRSELVQCIQLLLSGLQDMSRTVTTFAGKNTSTVLELFQL